MFSGVHGGMDVKYGINEAFTLDVTLLGHGGSSGRFEYLKEIALDYAFLFKLEGITQ